MQMVDDVIQSQLQRAAVEDDNVQTNFTAEDDNIDTNFTNVNAQPVEEHVSNEVSNLQKSILNQDSRKLRGNSVTNVTNQNQIEQDGEKNSSSSEEEKTPLRSKKQLKKDHAVFKAEFEQVSSPITKVT